MATSTSTKKTAPKKVATKKIARKTPPKKTAFAITEARKKKAPLKKKPDPMDKVLRIVKEATKLIDDDSDLSDLFIDGCLSAAKHGLLGGLNEDYNNIEIPSQLIINSYSEIVRIIEKYQWRKAIPTVTIADKATLKSAIEDLYSCSIYRSFTDLQARYKLLSNLVYTSEVIVKAKAGSTYGTTTVIAALSLVNILHDAALTVSSMNEAGRAERKKASKEYQDSCVATFDFTSLKQIPMGLANSIMWTVAKHMIKDASENKVCRHSRENPRLQYIYCGYPAQAKSVKAKLTDVVNELVEVINNKALTSDYDKEKAFDRIVAERAINPYQE